MTLCYLGLGSNLSSPERQLRQAIKNLRLLPATHLLRIAPFYHSKAWGRKSMPDYRNTVIAVKTRLSPQSLLAHCHKIERKQGRTRKIRWGSRTVDIDILLFGQQKINTARLQIPHPRLQERDFVLVPLLKIAPELRTKLQV